MAIHEITSTEVLQRCAKCSNENRIPLDSLEAGIARDEQTDGRIVPLPACPTCPSTEFLIRSPDDEQAYPAPGSFGHLHRMLVDQVHAELVKRKKVIGALKDKQGRVDGAIARPISNDDVQHWFPKGMKIELREAEQPVPPKETGQRAGLSFAASPRARSMVSVCGPSSRTAACGSSRRASASA